MNTMPENGATLYAKWEYIQMQEIRTITFVVNGGNAMASKNYLINSDIDANSIIPTRNNDERYLRTEGWLIKYDYYEITQYNFEGWYIDESLSTKFDNHIFEENITLYAKWSSTTYEEKRKK